MCHEPGSFQETYTDSIKELYEFRGLGLVGFGFISNGLGFWGNGLGFPHCSVPKYPIL